MTLRRDQPIFELGLKCHVWGRRALILAGEAEAIAERHRVTVLLTPQAIDLVLLAPRLRHVLLLVPHLDPVTPGAGSGAFLAEAAREAGAAGALLNHAERRLALSDIAGAIRRAKEVGLFAVVCADSPDQATAIAQLAPELILAEPPDLIGGNRSVAAVRSDFIAETLARVRAVNPSIGVLNSAGIRTPEDAAAVIEAGADGTGTTSGVVKAADPPGMLGAMAAAVEATFVRRSSGHRAQEPIEFSPQKPRP